MLILTFRCVFSQPTVLCLETILTVFSYGSEIRYPESAKQDSQKCCSCFLPLLLVSLLHLKVGVFSPLKQHLSKPTQLAPTLLAQTKYAHIIYQTSAKGNGGTSVVTSIFSALQLAQVSVLQFIPDLTLPS